MLFNSFDFISVFMSVTLAALAVAVAAALFQRSSALPA